MLKKVKVNEAVGMVLGHDMTKVVTGFKGVAFKRGHIIQEADVAELLSMGKEHIYIMEPGQNMVHEEEAALRICKAVSGGDTELTGPSEGRINIKSRVHGLLKINIPLLEEINSLGEIVVATLHANTTCTPGTMVAAGKIIPLYIS